MPRVYDSTSEPLDFCLHCFPQTEDLAFELYGHNGDGPDGRGNCFGYASLHPAYGDECDPKFCHRCGKELTSKDD